MDATPNSFRIKATVAISTAALVLIIDQIVKIYVKTHFLLHERVVVTDWFNIFFTENQGMAFGMSFIGTMFLTIFRLVAVAFFVYVLLRVIRNGKYCMGFLICTALVVAGAIGNIIDNCLYGLIFSESTPWGQPSQFVAFGNGYGDFLSGKVVDMFYFPLFVWPDWVPLLGGEYFFNAVFNVADASISCGAVAIILFYRKYLTSDLVTDKRK